ncbi:hypothetical protein LCGC14_0964890 [marine sediment metagenome]|uniref:Acb2/Tad1 hairpin domain-containing protein n=1 Tax=marine sediment metagenome TaxID=412755 RepID=A0A0F9NZH6_9ZZZZ
METFEFVIEGPQVVKVDGDGLRVNLRGNFEIWRNPPKESRQGDGDQEEPQKIVVAEFTAATVVFWIRVEGQLPVDTMQPEGGDTRAMTAGEKAVRLDFNPSKDGTVHDIKYYTAQLIDLCETLKDRDPRLAALAQTAYEEASMWAVKAATA